MAVGDKNCFCDLTFPEDLGKLQPDMVGFVSYLYLVIVLKTWGIK